METISKIRRDYYVHGKSLRRIARERKLSRNTVRKVIRENKTKFTYQRAIQPRRKMGDYVEQLDRLLSTSLLSSESASQIHRSQAPRLELQINRPHHITRRGAVSGHRQLPTAAAARSFAPDVRRDSLSL